MKIEILNQGRQSVTFRVARTKLILKTLISRYTDQRNIDRFRREFEIGYSLRHCKHIVSFLDYYDIYMDSRVMEDDDPTSNTTMTTTTTSTSTTTTTAAAVIDHSSSSKAATTAATSAVIQQQSVEQHTQRQATPLPSHTVQSPSSSSSASSSSSSSSISSSSSLPTAITVAASKDAQTKQQSNYSARYWLMRCNSLLSQNQLHATAIIIMGDFGGESLSNIIPPDGLTISDFLPIAIQVSKALSEMHRNNTIHRDIKPDNICINTRTRQVKVIDFGNATQLREVNMKDLKLEGTLGYISPEQTGRMNRNVDYRSDFYMTGCTFYQLLLGRLPFSSTTDARDLVYCHLAVEPMSPIEVSKQETSCRSTVPRVLSDIIMKLLNKNPEDRYQSSSGLLRDLRRCRDNWEHHHKIDYFAIAQNDMSEKFIIPNKIYGRSKEIDILKDAYERSRWNKVEVLTVSGYSGIGKSVLVREIEKPISLNRGIYISGKFDQYNRAIVLSALAEAFQALIKQILAEPESVISEYRERLIEVLGVNGQLIVNIIPELEKIIGRQEQVHDDIGLIETKNRFTLVFQDFVSVFTKKSHIVLFLDDLQWADTESMILLQVLLKNPNVRNMLFIGAYRDNEVNPSCPAMIALEEMKKDEIPVQEIVLTPLAFADVHQWISDTLNSSLEDSKALTDFVYARCDGNPFFVKQLLQTLYEKQVIYYKDDRWEYDVRELNFPAADNVIDLMVHRINQFSGKTKMLLQLASCLGNSFHLSKLELLSGQYRSTLMDDLYPALNNGFVNIVGETFRFAHDRVQEAAYSQFSLQERQTIHLKFARTLWKMHNESSTVDENICEIADHFNQAKQFLFQDDGEGKTDEIEQFANINLKAGQTAKKRTAYTVALEYITSGVQCFNFLGRYTDQWDTHYDVGFQLHKEMAEVYYLSSQYQKSDETLDLLLEHVSSDIEKVEVYNIRALQLQLLGNLKEAIDVGRISLKILGVELAEGVINVQKSIQDESSVIQRILHERFGEDPQLSSLADHPCQITHGTRATALKTLVIMLAAAYMWDPTLFGLIVTKTVRQSLEDGWLPDTPLCYMFYGVSLINSNNHRDQILGYKFGKLAVTLCEIVGNGVQKCKVYNVFGTMVVPWFHHVRHSEVYISIGYKYGLESGELQYAGYGRFSIGSIYYIRGEPINIIVSELDKMLVFLKGIQNQMGMDSLKAEQLMMYHLMGRRYPYHMSIEDQFAENDKFLVETKSLYANGHWIIYKAILLYIYDQDIETAYDLISDATDNYIRYMTGLSTLIIHRLYETLIICKLLHNINSFSHFNKGVLLEKLNKNRELIKDWVQNCSENFENKLLLIEAEVKRLDGDWDALDLYDRAIEVAQVQGFTSEGAIANELAGQFLLSKNKPHLAKHYLDQACKTFDLWGATRKVDLLQAIHRNLISMDYSKTEAYGSSSSRASTSDLSLALLDIDTVVRASQVISSTIDMKQLLFNVMKIITETSGAETGALIIDNIVEAYYRQQGSDESTARIETLCNIPLAEWRYGCRSIIEYVSRTKETIILHDAIQDSQQFKNHPYIDANKCKSILCMPIVRQDELKGLLYLENNLMSGAFNEQRQQVLSFVVSQVAISLENARFFQAQMEAAEKIAEIQRKRAREAEIFQRKQEDFIDRVCHEIRNPLSGVFGNLEAMGSTIKSLEEKLRDSSAAQSDLHALKECVDSIDICTRHQKNIADDVLLLSKLDSSSPIPLRPSPFHINEMLHSIVRMFQVEIEREGLSLSVQYLDPDQVVVADIGRITQVVVNLLSNSIKYNVSNGSISISVSVDRSSKPSLCFSIQDTGIGMSKSETSQLFNRFKQLEHKEDYSGSGLGLCITKSLVELMGGSIQVTSVPNEGTCFSFTVGCQLEEPSNKSSAMTQLAESRKEKLNILITEDNTINQRIFKKALENLGHSCRVANNGIEALELYQSQSDIQIILMDIRMPLMDGLCATKHIRQKEKELGRDRVVIIGLSGNAREEQVTEALESGMDAYLIKPIKTDELVSAVEKHYYLPRITHK